MIAVGGAGFSGARLVRGLLATTAGLHYLDLTDGRCGTTAPPVGRPAVVGLVSSGGNGRGAAAFDIATG